MYDDACDCHLCLKVRVRTLNKLIEEEKQVLNPAADRLNAIRDAWDRYCLNPSSERLGDLEEALENAFQSRVTR